MLTVLTISQSKDINIRFQQSNFGIFRRASAIMVTPQFPLVRATSVSEKLNLTANNRSMNGHIRRRTGDLAT
jgi:hypothetical protein